MWHANILLRLNLFLVFLKTFLLNISVLVVTLVQMFVVVSPVLPWFLPSFLHKTECDCLAFLRNICCSEVCWGRTEIDRRAEFICCVLYGTYLKSRKQLRLLNITVLDIRLAVRTVRSYFETAAFPVCSELWRILILWFLGFREPSFSHHLAFGSPVGSGLRLDAEAQRERSRQVYLDPCIFTSHPLYCQCCANMRVRGEVFLRKCLRFRF